MKIPNAVTLKVLVQSYYETFLKSDATSDSLDSAVRFLYTNGLITTDLDSNAFTTTEKGDFLVEHFLTIPLPEVEQVWVIPQ